jgi:hypothetical protein
MNGVVCFVWAGGVDRWNALTSNGSGYFPKEKDYNQHERDDTAEEIGE